MSTQRKLFIFPDFSKVNSGAIALGAMALLVAGCEGLTPTEDQQTQTGNGATTEELSEEVSDLPDADPTLGELVTLRGGVNEVIDDDSFLMNTADGDTILVFNPTEQTYPALQQQPEAQQQTEAGQAEAPATDTGQTAQQGQEDEDLEIPFQVTGTLEEFDPAQLEEQYGLTLDPSLYEDYDQQLVVVAENIALAPRPQEFWDAPVNYFENETVAIEGDLRPLEDTQNAFALFEEGWTNDVGVLVVGTQDLVDTENLEQGENIVVTGQAQPIDEATLQQANLGWDEAQIQEFISRYENRPVILAEQVYPSATPPHPVL